MALLIKNGEIVTAAERRRADIWCEGETITRIDNGISPPPGAEVIDAGGMYVFPGFIDPHTHIYLPCMGTYSKDDYVSGTQAALIGGTTTIFDMVSPVRQEEPLAAFETWRAQAAGKAACDYSFHIGVSRYDAAVESHLRELVAGGLTSFKVYLAYKGLFGLEDGELYRTLKLARELGAITAAHCENAALIEERQRELLAAGKTGPQWQEPSRPPIVEAAGVHHVTTFAELTGAAVYIVHLSCEPALRQALAARERGVRVGIETLVQFLLLDKSWTERPDFEGAKYVMGPPLRERCHQEVLWEGLRSGAINTVATDHAPFDFATQKRMGLHDFTKIPNGLPGIEDRINLLFTYGVKAGRLDLQRMVEAASTAPAELFGLYPRKGAIQPGSDADLVVYDPNYSGTISAATHRQNVDYNPYEGFHIAGRPHVVTVRGQVAVRDGRFVGTVGRGRLLTRQASCLV